MMSLESSIMSNVFIVIVLMSSFVKECCFLFQYVITGSRIAKKCAIPFLEGTIEIAK